ncbi:hypothetical protein TRFO_20318 [Tritrichomonas foetus]|uniref:CS domain-containing protein n=1 Tax=Tritrichomonas foetus TaxID=1144522 RepID=A0A1J4KGA4_9EUKA|nr:hypothetical protein TRFO_20318 [Tritrichomonas foetus]|eukprot:OHT10431.1 hypothetical protein TRFO_20318 [Tritrichomonas foetus]
MADDEETKYQKFGRNIKINLRKKDPNSWWPRLASTTAKLHNVKIDWEKWVDDSDDEINDGSVPINTPDDQWTDSDDDNEEEEKKDAEKSKVEEVQEEPAPTSE